MPKYKQLDATDAAIVEKVRYDPEIIVLSLDAENTLTAKLTEKAKKLIER
jgi:hypothetical protein